MNKIEQKLSTTLLNEILANESVLLMQTLHYHWNLQGPQFHDYHLLFDKQYNQLFADMDKIAERVRAVEGIALGSFKEILASATIKEDTGKIPTPTQMIVNLLQQYETLIEQIRSAIIAIDKKTTDFGSINFLEELITQHEKTAWMLRSLKGK
jgi:starvation-inducible DNA-binding protein